MTKTFFLAGIIFSLIPTAVMSDEWRLRSELLGPAGGTLFLSESLSHTKGCNGMFNASEKLLAKGEWKSIRSLCYVVNKLGFVQFIDPEKIRFFNTFNMAADQFSLIPTKKELAVIAEEEESHRQIPRIDENSRIRKEEISRRHTSN